MTPSTPWNSITIPSLSFILRPAYWRRPQEKRPEKEEILMDAYTSFASVYDTFMDNVPYKEWGKRIRERLCAYGVDGGIVLDLGCGTGSMTEILAGYGYDMIGVDNSEEMLEIAAEKRERSGQDILYLLQDMREFELYGTVRAIVSVCDSVNYITDPDELAEVFRLVNNYLDPDGIFLFDFNTEYKYRVELADRTFAEDRGDCSFIWDNYYYEDERINEYALTLFIREKGELYRRYQETHYQGAYTLEEIRGLVRESGLVFLGACDADTGGMIREDSGRICVTARKGGQP